MPIPSGFSDYQMHDVMENAMATRRFDWGCYVYPASWAWVRDWRKYNRTKKVYDCDPYAEVYQVRENMYAIFTENLNGGGDMWQYLIIGPQRAMLVDTGFGLGNYKALCDTITGGMELIVVNTHYGIDHALGDCWFERIYGHERLAPLLRAQDEHIWDGLFDKSGHHLCVEYDRSALPVFKPFEVIGVPDGYTWDLGPGYEIELIFTGGHTDHHAIYLDKHNRTLLCGDMICSSMTNCASILPRISRGEDPAFTNFPYFRERLAYIISRGNEFDNIFPGHYIMDVDKAVLTDELRAVDAIIANPDAYDFKQDTIGRNGQPRTIRYKNITNFGVITY